MSYERTISELAARHGGHITRAQLVELGLSDPMISRRVAAGFLTRVKTGVYRTFTPPDDDALLRGAVLSLRAAVVSHRSAARIHAFAVPAGGRPVVTVPASTTHEFPGVEVRRTADLSRRYWTVKANLPVTTVRRTVFDLASCMETDAYCELVDGLLTSRRLKLGQLAELLDEIGGKGKPGTTLVRAVVAERSGHGEEDATPLERLGLKVLRSGGCFPDAVQYDPGFVPAVRFDAAYLGSKVAIEWDSRRWHTSVDRFQSDRNRDRVAATHGWVTLRFTWDDLKNQPDRVISQVRLVTKRRSA